MSRRGAAIDRTGQGQAAAGRRHQLQDSPDNARRFLGRYGNPFSIVGVDGNGRASIEWGVYGVPETFVVGREGTIVYKMVGPVTPENIDSVLKAEIEKALKTVGSHTRHATPFASRHERQIFRAFICGSFRGHGAATNSS